MRWLKWFTLCYVLLIPQHLRVFMEYEYEIKFSMNNWTWFWYASCVGAGAYLAIY